MSESELVDTLRRVLDAHPDGALCVAFSGGPDSSALLHAMSALPEARARSLRAMHVDHGLHPDSVRWADHCRAFCNKLDITLEIQKVRVDAHAGIGLEAAAREARYTAFAATLQPGESLLTAHHRDDQAETVLLKLLRGAGPEGLGGMRGCRPFAQGWLWRPLLDTPRNVLGDYLREHAIQSIVDPSNASPHHARNFLRMEILPRLAGHWPNAMHALTHSARLSADAADYINVRSSEALATLRDARDASLDAHAWLALHPALRGPVLDQWLHAQGLTAPTFAQREQLQRQIREAATDRVPLVRWPGTAVHVWRGRLHAHLPLPQVPVGWKAPWDGAPLHLPGGAGTLRWAACRDTQTLPVPTLEVRIGETGIHLRPAGDRHTRALRDLYQRTAIPPWRRRRCPLIYTADGALLAVADLWQTEAGKALFDAIGKHPSWQPACAEHGRIASPRQLR